MLRSFVLMALLAVSVAACGGESEPTADPAPASSSAEVPAGSAPAPRGKVVLRVSGGEQGRVALDMRGIETLPRAEQTVLEPFLKRDVTFEGVWMKDLLAMVGVTGPHAVFRALDDYHVRFSAEELVDSGALLATRADGRRIPVADGGPIRIVFTGDTPTARNTDSWIWSLSTIRQSAG